MIRLDKLKLFPFKTQEIYFPGNVGTDVPLNIVFFPENSNFNLSFRKLKIPRRFVKYGTVLNSLVPRIIWNKEIVSQYLLCKLIPTRNFNPSLKNVFFDTTFFLSKLDNKYGKQSYRRPMVLDKIEGYLNSVNISWPARQNVLIYYVDTTQNIPDIVHNKRGWTLVDMFKRNEFLSYAYILMCVYDGKKTTYYMLKSPEKKLPWTRVYTVLQSLKHNIDSKNIEKSIDEISDDVIITSSIDKMDIQNGVIDTDNKDIDIKTDKGIFDKQEKFNSLTKDKEIVGLNIYDTSKLSISKNIENDIDSNDVVHNVTQKNSASVNRKVSGVVKQFLYNKPKLAQMLRTQPITPYTSQKLVLTSILDKNFRNPVLVKNAVEKIDPKNYQLAINTLKSTIVPNIVEHDKYENNARQYVYCDSHINDINEHKNPSAVLNKRKVDFNKNFEQDLYNSFQLLSKKSKYPLFIESIKSESVPVDPGDLRPTKKRRYVVTLSDERKRKHVINIDIPEVQKDGTFLINGSKKFMMYQLIIDPIFFLQKDEGKLQTAYATITVFRKSTKYKSYFEAYVSGYNIPLSLLFMYHIGFDSMCKLFGVKYQLLNQSDVSPELRNNYRIDLADGTCILFPEYTTLNTIPSYAYSLMESVKEIKGLKSINQIKDSKEVAELLVTQTDNRNSLFKIDQIVKNIMEPIAVEILKAKMLPTQLVRCLLYICVNIANGRVDDRNDISKQRLRSSEVMSYQIQKQILASYTQYETDRQHGNDDAVYFCDTDSIIKKICDPAKSKLMREVDNANPYDELSCMTSISPVGDGGVENTDGITNDARSIHPTYYGNVDAMDTPEGENIGIINHLTIDAMLGNSRGSFGVAADSEDKGVGSLGVCSSVVPFVNHNDGCRVMFSASQGRQAIPIIGAEKPLVQTGYETILTSMLSDSYVKKADEDGVVVKVTNNSITLKGQSGQEQIIEFNHPILKTSVGQIKGSINSFRSVVKEGEKVKSGQIVAEGKHIKDGIITVGSNVLVAMMGWKGYGFEDGYIISESLAKGKFTSTSYEEKEILITSEDNVKFIAKCGQFTKSGDTLLIRSSKNVEELLSMDQDELIDGQQVLKSPGGKIIEIEIYPNISISRFPVLRDEFLRWKAKYEEGGTPFPKKFFNAKSGDTAPFQGIRIVFKIERYDTCVLGDKITNNHGGKGTLTMIEKDENMPVTPWGERIDLIFNPIAVINRMNPGTIYELYCGLVAKCLARRFVQFGYKKNDKAIELASNVYKLLDNTKDKVLSTNLINSMKALTPQQYTEFVNQIIDDNYVMPIYVPHFKEPNLDMIKSAMKYLGLKDKYYLDLPEFGKTLEPVAVGYLYYKKLEQQASYKQSVRSTGRYNAQTGQATQGKASGGGQKVGEMDTWCLISHGMEKTLREIMGPLSDDMATKQEMISEIINSGQTTYKQPKKSPSTEKLKVYLTGCMVVTDF